MNIHVQIPQTSMDHLFNYIPGVASYKDYNVLTQASREKLLGNQGGRMSLDGTRMVKNDEPGLLDRAIEYLLDASTLPSLRSLCWHRQTKITVAFCLCCKHDFKYCHRQLQFDLRKNASERYNK
jgi:hypothetical protein